MLENEFPHVTAAETFQPLGLAKGIGVVVMLRRRDLRSVVLYWLVQRKLGAVELIYSVADVYQILFHLLKSTDHTT